MAKAKGSEKKEVKAEVKKAEVNKAEVKKAAENKGDYEVPKVISVTIGDNNLNGEFKEFSTGSKGWGVHGKVFINGVKCQVSCNIVIIGSKPTE